MIKADYSYKKIWTITYPVMISLLMQDLIGMTDTAFLGRVGEVELGASALAGIYYLVIYIIGFGFSVGAEILIARLNGEGKYRQMGSVFYHGVAALLVMAAAMYILTTLLSPTLLRMFIQSDAIYEATMDYMRWRVFGFFFSFIGIMFRAFYMATTKTKILTINSLVMVLANVGLNYVLIFGKFGFPALGIAGAAIASTVSELISVIFYVLYTRYATDFRKYGMFRREKYDFKVQRRIFRVSGWTMVQYFLSCGTWLFFFMAIEHLGERSLAVSNIVRNVSMLLYLFVSAYATTGSAMVSNLMGTGQHSEVMGLCRRIVKMSAVSALPLALLVLFAPGLVLRIFTDSAEIIAGSIPSLMVMLCSYIFALPGFIYFLAISGTGNTKAAFGIESSVLFVYVVYIYIVAVRLNADVAVVWTVEIVYNMLMLALALLYFKRSNWAQKKI